jgi:hypothetical protein
MLVLVTKAIIYPTFRIDAVAFALAKALALLGEAFNPDRWLLRWEGLFKPHVQGAGEGDEAKALQKEGL